LDALAFLAILAVIAAVVWLVVTPFRRGAHVASDERDRVARAEWPPRSGALTSSTTSVRTTMTISGARTSTTRG